MEEETFVERIQVKPDISVVTNEDAGHVGLYMADKILQEYAGLAIDDDEPMSLYDYISKCERSINKGVGLSLNESVFAGMGEHQSLRARPCI